MPRTKRRKIVAKAVEKAFPNTNTVVREENSFLDLLIIMFVVLFLPVVVMLFV